MWSNGKHYRCSWLQHRGTSTPIVRPSCKYTQSLSKCYALHDSITCKARDGWHNVASCLQDVWDAVPRTQIASRFSFRQSAEAPVLNTREVITTSTIALREIKAGIFLIRVNVVMFVFAKRSSTMFPLGRGHKAWTQTIALNKKRHSPSPTWQLFPRLLLQHWWRSPSWRSPLPTNVAAIIFAINFIQLALAPRDRLVTWATPFGYVF